MLVDDEIAPYRTQDRATITMAGPSITLVPDLAQAMSLTLHELATNAAKYGGLATPDGEVTVRWDVVHETNGGHVLELEWKERTGRLVETPERESFGAATIRNLLRYEYQARVELNFESDGVRCAIALPLELNRIVDPGVGTTSQTNEQRDRIGDEAHSSR